MLMLIECFCLFYFGQAARTGPGGKKAALKEEAETTTATRVTTEASLEPHRMPFLFPVRTVPCSRSLMSPVLCAARAAGRCSLRH